MSNINFSLEPREFIAEIRTSYRIDDPGTKMLREQLNNTLKLLSEDLYSDDTHFVSELIQNADDNEYEPNVVPRLTFSLNPNKLVIVNNEIGFSAKNVYALCLTGSSTKKGNKYKTGEKGIGFKSVFTVSDTPEIHSNEFHFKFDRTVKDKPLGFVIPYWIDDSSDAVNGETVIVLPAPKDEKFDASKLHSLDPYLLLFLRKLRKIEIHEKDVVSSFCRLDKVGITELTLSKNTRSNEVISEKKQYLRTNCIVEMYSVQEEKRPGIDKTEIVLAFPISELYEAQPDIKRSKIYAFLPIRQAGFRFSIQADFLLNASRGEIREGLLWNIRLRDAIASAFVSALDEFKKYDQLAYTYLAFIPHGEEVSGEFLSPVRSSIIELLTEKQCLLSESEVWSYPIELRLATDAFRELFPSEVAKLVFGFDYLHKSQKVDDEILKSLQVKRASFSDVILIFKDHQEWLEDQPRDWKKSLYSYISEFHKEFIEAGIKQVSFLPLEGGSLVTPKKQDVYFPLSKGKKYGFEKDLNVLDFDLFEGNADLVQTAKEFLLQIGVYEDNPYNMIVGHIVPKHAGEGWQTVGHPSLLGHLRYIKDKFTAYLSGASQKSMSKEAAVSFLREKIFIGTNKKTPDGIWTFSKSEHLYLGNEYSPDFSIESFLAGSVDASIFVSNEYLTKKDKEDIEALKSWRIFLNHLGINDTPKIKNILNDWQCSDELRSLLKSPHAKVRAETLICISRNWSYYRQYVEYGSGLRSRGKPTITDSEFIKTLRQTIVSGNRKSSVALDQAYYPSREIKTVMGNSVCYVDESLQLDMLKVCQVSTVLNAHVLIKRIKQIKLEDSGDTLPAIQKIYTRIEEIFEDEKDFILQSFANFSLIRVKGPNNSWRKPEEVCWITSGSFLDSICPPLDGQYKDFSKFFAKLGVKNEIPIEKRIDALEQLGNWGSIEERKKVALSCYQRFSKLLRKFNTTDEAYPEWIDDFSWRQLFLDRNGNMVDKDSNLFIDDKPNISCHFADETDISFLAVSMNDLPSLQKFFDASGVSYVSKSCSAKLINSNNVEIDATLTSTVRQCAAYFARILYAKDFEAFEEAQASRILIGLKSLEIFSAEDVQVCVSLASVDRLISEEIARDGQRIVYKKGSRSIKDRISLQICDYLHATPTLSEIFARILLENNSISIDEFLEEKQIGVLPDSFLFATDNDSEIESNHDPDESENFKQTSLEVDELVSPSSDEKSKANALSQSGDNESPNSKSKIDASGDKELSDRSATFQSVQSAELSSISDKDKDKEKNQQSTAGIFKKNNEEIVELPRIVTAPSNPLLSSLSTYSEGSVNQNARSDAKVNSPGKRKTGKKSSRKTKTGNLLSYVLLKKESDEDNQIANKEAALEKKLTGAAAVKFFIENHSTRWKSLTEMHELNHGFDVLAVAHDGKEEFIEVKGQTDVWSERGVTLTPRELQEAQKHRGRYWLCVVEYVHDDVRRRMYLFKDPYGLTDQFKFDSGWKAAAIAVNDAPLLPESGRYVEIEGKGRARITNVKKYGEHFKIDVIFDDGRTLQCAFKPSKMTVTEYQSGRNDSTAQR